MVVCDVATGGAVVDISTDVVGGMVADEPLVNAVAATVKLYINLSISKVASTWNCGRRILLAGSSNLHSTIRNFSRVHVSLVIPQRFHLRD